MIELAGVEAVDACTIRTSKSLDDCFALFPLIHRVTSDLNVLRRVAMEMAEDFAADNCMYEHAIIVGVSIIHVFFELLGSSKHTKATSNSSSIR